MSPAPSSSQTASPSRTWVRLALDYAGPAAFMVGFFLTHSVLSATWGLVAASALALVFGFALERRIAPSPLIWGGAALLFGVLTLVFHDVRIVKMKTTIIDAGLGVVMLGGLAPGRSPVKLLMGQAISLPEPAWRKLTLRFGVFFLALAVCNEIIWRTQPDAVWVMFRFPGLLILSLLFSATQLPAMIRGAQLADAERAEAAVRLAETQE